MDVLFQFVYLQSIEISSLLANKPQTFNEDIQPRPISIKRVTSVRLLSFAPCGCRRGSPHPFHAFACNHVNARNSTLPGCCLAGPTYPECALDWFRISKSGANSNFARVEWSGVRQHTHHREVGVWLCVDRCGCGRPLQPAPDCS